MENDCFIPLGNREAKNSIMEIIFHKSIKKYCTLK